MTSWELEGKERQECSQCQMPQRGGKKMGESRGALGIPSLGSYWCPQTEVLQASGGDKGREAETPA